MRELIGKKCKISIKCDNKFLFFTGTILEITEKHISFQDKFGELCFYNLDCVIQVREVQDD